MTAAPSAASAWRASGRTLDGPQPNRPSAGSSSAGIWMLIREVPLGMAPSRPGTGSVSGGCDLGGGLGLDGVPAVDLVGLARVRADVARRRAHQAAGLLLL